MLLKEYKSIVKTENGYIIHADAADLMLVFLKEDVIRIRVSFDRTFPEASYALVTTAWEDRKGNGLPRWTFLMKTGRTNWYSTPALCVLS